MKKSWKADEMEMSINFKAMRLSFAFGLLFLAVWVIVDFIKYKELGIPFIFLITQNLVFIFSKLLLTRIIVGKDKKHDQ